MYFASEEKAIYVSYDFSQNRDRLATLQFE